MAERTESLTNGGKGDPGNGDANNGEPEAPVLSPSEERMAVPLYLEQPDWAAYYADTFIEKSMPCCPCFPNRLGCLILAVLQCLWSLLQLLSLIIDAKAFPVPFYHIERTIRSQASVYAYAIVTVFVILLAAAYAFSVIKLRHVALQSCILGAGVFGAVDIFVAYATLLIDIQRESDSVEERQTVIVAICTTMSLEILFRTYAIISAVRLWKTIPHHGPFWFCCAE